MNCPLLGIFGNEDARPSPEEVDLTELVLKQNNKVYDFHRYDDAGHGFFAVDRPSYRQAAATDAWDKVIGFYNQYLSTPTGAPEVREAVAADDN
jgi:carboxymethylenebutenolidase